MLLGPFKGSELWSGVIPVDFNLNFTSRVLPPVQHFLHDVSCRALEKFPEELMELGDF